MLFIRRFLGIDTVDQPISRLGRLCDQAAYVRDLEVDVVARAIAEVFGDG